MWFLSYLALDILLYEVVLAFVVEYDVNLLGAVSTDVGSCKQNPDDTSLFGSGETPPSNIFPTIRIQETK